MHAAKHAARRECVSCGSTTRRHVSTPRDGKVQLMLYLETLGDFLKPIKVIISFSSTIPFHFMSYSDFLPLIKESLFSILNKLVP